MIHSLLQQSSKIGLLSASVLPAMIFASLPSYSQDLGTFRSGPIRSDREFNRSLQSLQSSRSEIICGNDIGRSRFHSSFRRRFASNTLTNDPLIPNRLNAQQFDNQQFPQALINDPLVPNRLNTRGFNSGFPQISRHALQSVTCQTIRGSSITTVNQPLSNHSVNITINNRSQSDRTVAGSRSASDSKLPLGVANLPDGNYRIISAANVANDISNAELANRGGRLFTFSKSGNTVTGNLNDFDSGFSACVAGSLNGNLVTGQAFTNDLATNVLGRNYLGLGLALELGEHVAGDRYDNSVLNLSGFSRINAGTASPPTRC